MVYVGGHESLRVRSAKLAAAAAALKRDSGVRAAPFSLAFLTDRRRVARPEPVIRALPGGSAVIYRDYDDPKRAAIARRYAAMCRSRGVLFLIAEDAPLALSTGADGVHLPSRAIRKFNSALYAPAVPFILTASCHNAEELRIAAEAGVDAALLSPVFATDSHPDTDELGSERFKALAAAAAIPVLALGGVNETNARRLAGRNVAGIAAIGAFVSRQGVSGGA